MLPDSKFKIQNSEFKIAVTGLCLLFLPSCGKQEQAVFKPVIPASVSFAVFGNTGLVTDGGSTFRSLASSLDSIDVDFAVELGNKLPPNAQSAGSEVQLDASNRMMHELTVPVYPVVGALDVFDYPSDMVYSSLYGPMWYSFKRGGTLFIVLNTGDDSYRSRFGVSASIGEDQLAWLNETLNGVPGEQVVVIFMNRPVWYDNPSLWKEQLLPVLLSGGVDLVVTCYNRGLFDWGAVDGIRAVSTGCVGPSFADAECGIGLFPHVLLATLDGENSSFRVLSPDGVVSEGIGIDKSRHDMAKQLVDSLTPGILDCDLTWTVSSIQEYRIENPFDEPVNGSMNFTIYKGTSWEITPQSFTVSLDRGETKTYSVVFNARESDLTPVPTYRLSLKVGDTTIADTGGTILRKIPVPRLGERIPIAAQIADMVPYSFDGKTLRVPVDVSGLDKCGRLVLYREDATEVPRSYDCVYISPLQDFKLGINEFTWNGRDIHDQPVSADSLDYYVVIYNKKSPPTWVAEGPPSLYGDFRIQQTIGGLVAETHTDSTLVRYRVTGSIDHPEAETVSSLVELLDGLSAVGVAYEREDRLFVTTEKGLVCAVLNEGNLSPDPSFGDNGYLIFDDFRGRRVGNPTLSRGIVYVGIGGGDGESPMVISVDSKSGEITGSFSLGDYFKGKDEPPALEATEQGLYISHPDGGYVLHMRDNGDLLWINEPGESGGDLDTDGRSYTYRIGVDQFGFSYVNSPGTSARCTVLGPDGRALFRVILVILPGLRVSSAVPMIEGKSTDGLYFITRGADRPYVFHVPYTVKHGSIIDESLVMTRQR